MTAVDRARERTVAESLLRLPYETWAFGDSIAFEALLEASQFLGDPRYAAFAHGWMRSWATRAQPYRRLDCTAPGLAMVHAADLFDDGRLRTAAAQLADYLLTRPRIRGVFSTWDHAPLRRPWGPQQLGPHEAALLADPPAGVFVDCLHFDPPFFTALGAATGDERYWREGLAQAEGYISLLQVDSGLFDHFVLEGEPGRFGPGWGRGQGWALLGLLDVAEAAERLPLDSASADTVAHVRDAAAHLIRAMRTSQRDDGHWPCVVTEPTAATESSTAAFMAVGMRRALELGVVDASERAEVAASAESAGRAVLAALDPDGTLADVSAAVWASTEPSHYVHAPRGFLVPWGQGPALLAMKETAHAL